MDSGLKQRLIGAAVLVALAVIFLPMLVQGPAPDSGVSDLPLTMPDAPKGDYETQDLPLVVPGAAPNGGAVGLDPSAEADPTVRAGTTTSAPPATVPPSVSQAIPLGDSGVSTPAVLPKDPAVVTTAVAAPATAKPAGAKPAGAQTEAMLPATSAGVNYVVHFAPMPACGADAVVKLAKAAQLPPTAKPRS